MTGMRLIQGILQLDWQVNMRILEIDKVAKKKEKKQVGLEGDD